MSTHGSKDPEKPLVRDALELLEDDLVSWEALHGGDLSEVGFAIRIFEFGAAVFELGPGAVEIV